MRFLYRSTVVFVIGISPIGCSDSTAPPRSVGNGCGDHATSTVYEASLKGWLTTKYTRTITTRDVTDKNGRVYRQEVIGCVTSECLKLDPNKTLTAQQAAASCTV